MTFLYPDAVIQVFCKAPVAGQVKTRLTPDLTPEHAAQVHKQLTLSTLTQLVSYKLCPIQLWCTPSLSHPFFIEMAETFSLTLQLQSPGDLGQRMFNALNTGLGQFGHAIIMGCDCPSLKIKDLTQAINALSTKYEYVIAPAEDGGYCLIGTNKPCPELFEDISWGNSTVLNETRKKIKASSLKCLELETQWDVDNYNDYLRYINSVLPGSSR